MANKMEKTTDSSEPASAPTQAASGKDADNVIVIHPGSLTTIFGKATDPLALSAPSLIAFRRPVPLAERPESVPYDFSDTQEQREAALEEVLKEVEEIRDARGNLLPGRRIRSQTHTLQDDNSRLHAEKIPAHNDVEAVDAYCGEDSVLVGSDVYQIPFDDVNYKIMRPFCPRDREQMSPVEQRGATSKYLTGIIAGQLKISQEELPGYYAVLLVADTCSRNYIKNMIDILLTDVKFGGVLVHHASVSSTFGAGLTKACVVDIGHSTCDISCIVDGVSDPRTRIQQPYGGRDIEQALHWDLMGIGLELKPPLDAKHPLDRKAIRRFKESYCTLNLDEAKRQRATLMIRRPGQASKRQMVQIDKQVAQAPLGLFFPALFGIKESERAIIGAPSDVIAEDADLIDIADPNATSKGLIKRPNEIKYSKPKPKAKKAKTEKGPEEAAGSEPATPAPEAAPVTAPAVVAKSEEVSPMVMSLAKAVMASILAVPDNSAKQGFAATILAAGGGFHLRGLLPMLQQQMYRAIPFYYGKLIEHITVIDRPKEIDPEYLAWKGGCIIATFNVTKECWITADEWQRHGVRLARERLPFEW